MFSFHSLIHLRIICMRTGQGFSAEGTIAVRDVNPIFPTVVRAAGTRASASMQLGMRRVGKAAAYRAAACPPFHRGLGVRMVGTAHQREPYKSLQRRTRAFPTLTRTNYRHCE